MQMQEASIRQQTMQQEGANKLMIASQQAQAKAAMDAATFEENRERERLAFGQKQKFEEQAFRSKERRADAAESARAENRVRLDNERDAEDRKKPRKMKVAFARDKDGKLSGAEVEH
jgi:hypothetical protein